MGETNGKNGRLNGSTGKWIAIVIASVLAVLGWSRNYGLEAEVTKNCETIKENTVTIGNLRTAAASDHAILVRIETDVRDIKVLLQEKR